MNAAAAACPRCRADPGCLGITDRLQARPLGSFSVAGAQLKVSARSVPVLRCSACGLELVGEYTGDGHAAFTPVTQ